MKTVLFQGDSITDVNRIREFEDNLGMGYANLIAAELGYEFPCQYKFINRGISGNRSVDLYARVKKDIINLKPDVLSILIGVNDVWHEFGEYRCGVDADKYYKIYCMLIEEVLDELPDLKIMLLEPFVLKGTATMDNWTAFQAETEKRAEIVKEVAEKYNLIFVPLQKRLDLAAEKFSAGHWLSDGVHPTAAGHELIKRAWVESFFEMNMN